MFCTNKWWNENIVKDSAPVFIHNIEQTSDLYKRLADVIQNKTKFYLGKHNIMFYYWNRYSYIPWHSDEIYDGAVTIYLNEFWEPDFGGYFLYHKDKKDIRAIIPTPNAAVLQYGGVRHCTTPVNFTGDIRITIQAFLYKDKK